MILNVFPIKYFQDSLQKSCKICKWCLVMNVEEFGDSVSVHCIKDWFKGQTILIHRNWCDADTSDGTFLISQQKNYEI